MLDIQAFKRFLHWAEGLRLKPYKCSAGKLTIGVGRNLDDRGITRDEADFLLETDIADTLDACRSLPYWDGLDPARKLVVADMLFNLGLTRFLKFKKFNAALENHDYPTAAQEMEDSRWYTQVGRRAKRLQTFMLEGELDV